jgi:hypothetical protein
VSADDIRIAWNVVSERLTAVHPDDGTFPAKEVTFAEAGRTELPGGPRLILGPTLAEIIRAFGYPPVADNGKALT